MTIHNASTAAPLIKQHGVRQRSSYTLGRDAHVELIRLGNNQIIVRTESKLSAEQTAAIEALLKPATKPAE